MLNVEDDAMDERKWVLITGATSPLGRALALALGERGYGVVVHYRTQHSHALALAAQLQALGSQVHLLRADLSSLTLLQQFLEEVQRLPFVITHLINNA